MGEEACETGAGSDGLRCEGGLQFFKEGGSYLFAGLNQNSIIQLNGFNPVVATPDDSR